MVPIRGTLLGEKPLKYVFNTCHLMRSIAQGLSGFLPLGFRRSNERTDNVLALVKTKERNTFKVEDKSLPQLERDEVLIKVEYCGVCGSDLHAANHDKGYEFVPNPIILGHELSGVVTKVHPDNNQDDLVGLRAVLFPGEYCKECEHCKNNRVNICSNIQGVGLHYDGGMAEYVKVKSNLIQKIPDTLPSDIAALAEPLTVAIHAVQNGNIKNNDKVFVQGCGIIGLFAALVAKEHGADVTISGLQKDWNYRLKHAKMFGLKTEIYEEQSNGENEYDTIFECSGSSLAAEGSITRLKKGGKLVVVALFNDDVRFPINIMVRREIDVLTSYASLPEDFKKAFIFLEKYQELIKQIVSIYPLEKGALAFSDAQKQKVLKPLIKML